MNNLKTILLIDDELENLRIYDEILTDLNYRVLIRSDAAAALELITNGIAADLVITDYRMPGMSGLEFAKAIRQLGFDVPVIMLTAYGSVAPFIQAENLGDFEYVHKSIGKCEFERVVNRALNKPSQVVND